MKHNAPNKIIFLDVDGVINTERTKYERFDENAMEMLHRIIDSTGAKIVVSSSWRDSDFDSMFEKFREYGCSEKIIFNIIDITIRGYKHVIPGSKLPILRGNEIKAWVDTHLIYPWHSDESLDGLYKMKRSDGTFLRMYANKVGVDFNYVILDDDSDMLLEQERHFIKCNPTYGITAYEATDAVIVLGTQEIINTPLAGNETS